MGRKGIINLICWLFFLDFIAQEPTGFSQESIGKGNKQHLNQPVTISVIDSMNKAAYAVFRTDPAKTRSLAFQSLEYATAINFKPGAAKACNYIGMTFHMADEYDSAAGYYKKSLEIFRLLNDTLYIGKVYNNLALLYSDQEYNNLALEYNLKSLEIAEALNDTVGLLKSYNNIGISFEDLEKYDDALEYFRKMLELLKSTSKLKGDYYSALGNIGLMHIYQNNFATAAAYLNEVLAYFKTVEDNYGIEQTYSYIGLMYLKTNQPDSALLAFAVSDRYAKILDDKNLLATNGYHLGELYYQLEKYMDAKAQFEKVLRLARRNSFLKIEMDSYFYLSKIDSISRDFPNALENYKAGVELHDRINSISVQKQIAELNIQYESRKKNQEITYLKQGKEIQDLKMKKQLLQRNLLLVILFVVISFVGFVFYSGRKIRIANILLAKQNEEIALKNASLLQQQELLEEKVEERTAELLKAKEKAEESDRLKSAFLANMSHEIRTPLNGILGFMELLQDRDLSQEDQENYSGIIRKSSDRLLNTITNIIDFSKIESGQMQLYLTDFDFVQRLKFLHGFFHPEAASKELRLEINAGQPDGPAIIRSDKDKLDAIITNLIKNAIKYTNQGTIELGYQIQGGVLVFYVKDTGIGIRPDRLVSIFDRFIQIHDNLNRTFEGSGLGLAISKAYVEMLGGIIEVESEEKKGSIFRIRIPFA